jgi:hypothetical protein
MADIKLTLTIPLKVYNSCAKYWGYSSTILDGEGNSIPNPVSKRTFMKRKNKSFFKKAHQAIKSKIDSEAAKISAINLAGEEADAIIVTSEEVE